LDRRVFVRVSDAHQFHLNEIQNETH
jgi:hypothetical protein